ncbi:MAG: hypothetical protein ACXWL2_03930 [Candidatus Chromulinivorax sp.]
MKKKLSVKNIIESSWQKLLENIVSWFTLFALQSIVIVGFLICCSAALAVLHYLFIDLCLFNCFFNGYSKIFTIFMVCIVCIFALFFYICFPIMYRQNALDATFNRPMNGFDVNNRFFSYAVAMFLYWMFVWIGLSFLFLPGIFLAQRWRFAGLYILDHGGCVRQAFNSSWYMTKGYMWFLVGISMIQWLIFVLCSPTIILVVIAVAINRLIDAHIYKQLHMEYDKNIEICSCEN